MSLSLPHVPLRSAKWLGFLFSLVISGMEHIPFKHARFSMFWGSFGKTAVVACCPRAPLAQLCSWIFSKLQVLTNPFLLVLASHTVTSFPTPLLQSQLLSSPPSPSIEQLRATLSAAVSFPRRQNSNSHRTWQLVFLWRRAGRNQQVATIPGHKQKFCSSL